MEDVKQLPGPANREDPSYKTSSPPGGSGRRADCNNIKETDPSVYVTFNETTTNTNGRGWTPRGRQFRCGMRPGEAGRTQEIIGSCTNG